MGIYRAVIADFKDRPHRYQVVFDRWVGLREFPDGHEVDVEVVLYRHGKHHGKHVALTAWLGKRDREVAYLSLEVRGIVLETEIRMERTNDFPAVDFAEYAGI